MAEFNSCKDLVKNNAQVSEIVEKMGGSKNQLQDMLDMQEHLQTTLAGRLPEFNIKPSDIKTKGELVTWIDGNFDAIMDEYRELKNSIGGMSNGEKNASAVWKKWKSNHGEMREELLSDMSDDDRTEMLMEFIDIWHFVLNMALGMGMSAEDMYVLYMLKNYENYDRYTKRDY